MARIRFEWPRLNAFSETAIVIKFCTLSKLRDSKAGLDFDQGVHTGSKFTKLGSQSRQVECQTRWPRGQIGWLLTNGSVLMACLILSNEIENWSTFTYSQTLGNDFLPPANEVCEGYVFTGVCLSTGGGRACHMAHTPPGNHARPPRQPCMPPR